MISDGVENRKYSGNCSELYYFQHMLFGEEIFGGSFTRIIVLSFLLNTLSLLAAIFMARVLYMFWKNVTGKGRVISIILSCILLLLFFVLCYSAFIMDDTIDFFFLNGLLGFFFGNAYSAPSQFSAKAVQITVLVLCLQVLQNRCALKHRRKVKVPHRAALISVRAAAVCAAGIFSMCTVYYCSPTAVNHYEFSQKAVAKRVAYYYYYDYGDTVDFDAGEMQTYQPNEKAYRLLKIQERFAEEPYKAHIARHMVDKYYSPPTYPLPYTDYEHGKQYYELSIAEGKTDSIFPYSYFITSEFPGLYCRYLYEGGEREAALAYYKSIPKETPTDWMPEIGNVDLPYYLNKTPQNRSNFLLYLYTNPNQQDARFAAQEMVLLASTYCTIEDASTGISLFSALWNLTQNDEIHAYLAEETLDYAELVHSNVAPYTDDYRAKTILKELQQLCEKTGVSFPKGGATWKNA